MLVAPAIGRLDVSAEPQPGCPWLIVQGEADDMVPSAEVIAWAGTLTPPPALTLLPATGHFFHGRINELRAAVLAFMEQAQER